MQATAVLLVMPTFELTGCLIPTHNTLVCTSCVNPVVNRASEIMRDFGTESSVEVVDGVFIYKK